MTESIETLISRLFTQQESDGNFRQGIQDCIRMHADGDSSDRVKVEDLAGEFCRTTIPDQPHTPADYVAFLQEQTGRAPPADGLEKDVWMSTTSSESKEDSNEDE